MKIRIALIVISINLILGNAIFHLGFPDFKKISIAVSISCVLVYTLFFKYMKFEKYSDFKLFIVSVGICMFIVYGGLFLVWFVVVLMAGDSELLTEKKGFVVVSWIIVNSFLFPINLFLGLLNYWLLQYLKRFLVDK